jgi:aspartate racemase
MRTIGLIGGTSWESTAVYYRLLNEGARARLGGLSSARVAMISMDFAPLEAMMREGRWDALGAQLADEARRLESAGASCVALCTNTMHKVADRIVAATGLPFLDVRDVTARALAARGVKRPLLLATRYTMEDAFFVERLRAAGFAPLTPQAEDRARLQAIIFDELCVGRIEAASKRALLDIVRRGLAAGADSVILGCTELMLLIGQDDVSAPVFDTTALHVEACLDHALSPVSIREVA